MKEQIIFCLALLGYAFLWFKLTNSAIKSRQKALEEKKRLFFEIAICTGLDGFSTKALTDYEYREHKSRRNNK